MKISRLLAFLLLPALFTGCKPMSAVDFDALKNGSTPGVSIKNGEYYVKGSLDGKAFNWAAGNDINGFIMGPVIGMSNGGSTRYGSTQCLFTKLSLVPNFGIEFTSIKLEPGEDHTAKFNSFITTGLWSYITDNVPQDLHGVNVYYTDEQGNTYGSPGKQTDALKVISITKIPANALHGAEMKVLVTFSCILYPDDQTKTPIKLTNGEATIQLEDPFVI